MKKNILSVLSLALLLCICITLASCSKKPTEDEKISIVCTLFPQYDWLSNIIKDNDNTELTLLIANGADAHSYQPTAADIMKIANCDMLVCTGGDSEAWVKEAIEHSSNKKMKVVTLNELEGAIIHNISSSSHTHDHGHEEHNHGVFDEHIWLSLTNATLFTQKLTDVLCELDSQNAEAYRSNAMSYTEQLNALHNKYTRAVNASIENDRFMIFADRFPFVYLLSDYGIEYSAAFEGCTTDVDADFDTIIRLIEEAEHHGARYITVCENSPSMDLAKTVIGSAKHAKMEILTMNSLQSVSRKDIENGIQYLSVMEQNLQVLKIAINSK